MKFDIHIPTPRLRPYIQQYAVSENAIEQAYKVLPSTGMVIGFQYKGQLSTVQQDSENTLHSAGITGLTNGFKIFKNAADTGTVLVYFTEVGFAHFAAHPAHELFNLSVSLEDIFDKSQVREIEDKLAAATLDSARVQLVEHFLLKQLRDIEMDRLIVEAVKLIYASKGTLRVKELNETLYISQSPFEKRFRKVVGTSPKKFASIVRFNAVLDELQSAKTLTEICYAHNFFDQAHFIKDFKQFTGDTPENFKRSR